VRFRRKGVVTVLQGKVFFTKRALGSPLRKNGEFYEESELSKVPRNGGGGRNLKLKRGKDTLLRRGERDADANKIHWFRKEKRKRGGAHGGGS